MTIFTDILISGDGSVFDWAKQFLEGRKAVENEPHERRFRMNLTDAEIFKHYVTLLRSIDNYGLLQSAVELRKAAYRNKRGHQPIRYILPFHDNA